VGLGVPPFSDKQIEQSDFIFLFIKIFFKNHLFFFLKKYI
jgi:hypothetical protein